MGKRKEVSEDRRTDENHDDHAGAVPRPQQRPVKRGDCDLAFSQSQGRTHRVNFESFRKFALIGQQPAML
jgi:hypothetical protein